jgi:hypothetical protein
MIPAWIPLAVLLGAACTVPRLRWAGAALGAVLIVGFVTAGVEIDGNTQYQRPDWRNVARALGAAARPRAIVAYDGQFAAQPLAVYLHGVPWTTPASAALTLNEIDVVGSPWQTVGHPLPAGVRLLSSRTTAGFLVDRFVAAQPWRLTPGAIAARAQSLLGPGPPDPAVLVQRPG